MKRKVSSLILAAAAIGFTFSTAYADVIGSSSASFVNPQPGLTAVTTGVGTKNFTYGTPTGNPVTRLVFDGVSSFDQPFETPFKVGTLTFTNGSINAGTDATSVDLKLALAFSSPNLGSIFSTFTLNLVSTPNVGSANDQADYVYFPSSFATTTFEIGGTTYTVKLMGFDNFGGSGFLDSDNTRLHVLEGRTGSADLLAEVTSSIAAVPEASTWAMMLLGFAGIGFAAFRRKTAVGIA